MSLATEVRCGLYGVLAEFTSADDLLRAIRSARSRGYARIEAYTPHPVEEVSRELGHQNRLPLLVLVCGLVGAVTGFALQYHASVVDYPIRVAGKAAASWPAFVVVAFELAILFAALGAVVGMFALNRLPQPHHPVFAAPGFERASSSAFFLVLLATNSGFDPAEARHFLEDQGAALVAEVPLR